MKHEVHPGVQAHASDAAQIQLADTKGHETQMDAARAQIQSTRLFTSPVPVPAEDAETVLREVLQKAGCSHHRDSADQRIIADVQARKFLPVLRSQTDVGGWPVLE